jgi:hypothetical protein
MTLKKLYEQIESVEDWLAQAKTRQRTKRQAELERKLRGLRLQQMQLERRVAAKIIGRAA